MFVGEVGLAAFAVVLVGFLHSRGVQGVGRTQVVMTGLLVAAVALVGIGALTGPGASVANWESYFAPGRSAWTGVLAMLAISPWLYVGFDTLPQAAEEFAFPAGRAFRLMAAAILAGAGMYVVVVLATGVVLPLARVGGRRVRLGDRRRGAGEPGNGGSGHPERCRRPGDLHRN